LLYYGHYDVQPAEPLELWDSPPFEPLVLDGPRGRRVVARGAVDDKGQVALWLAAFRAWHETEGAMPLPITVVIEGEEEVRSDSLEPFLTAHAAELSAEGAVISDTAMWDPETPALTTSLRGMASFHVELAAADMDLHSGLYGGSALNPINALTRALGQLKDADGRIQLDGFYDGVAEVPADQAAQWAALDFDERAFLAEVGLSEPYGEAGRFALERIWARPTADIHGIWGGYAGPGSKTVIAATAGAKVSFRLAPGQEPAKVAASFRRFLAARVPADAKLTIEDMGVSEPVRTPVDSRLMRAARAALAEEFGRPALLVGSGGSIPVVEAFKRLLGLDTVMMGFGLADDLIHSPNEKFEWACFRRGARSHVRLLDKLSAGAAR
jgi:acetylornithine deacetylase/succinyl-diaminopimelate desuccinylase-like protein